MLSCVPYDEVIVRDFSRVQRKRLQHTHTYFYEHTYVNSTSMSISDGAYIRPQHPRTLTHTYLTPINTRT